MTKHEKILSALYQLRRYSLDGHVIMTFKFVDQVQEIPGSEQLEMFLRITSNWYDKDYKIVALKKNYTVDGFTHFTIKFGKYVTLDIAIEC